ncbi:developmental regulator [Colletotrichum karsti]|uniref:Developmental regulator n=1 Tax=Colletotrichum karsti TaxID=1095194 RepID=A0A9P6IAJ2_9PEZI|nr:developmental regulator [Colletotrichum karsti]KAF9878990.1 developmental regulator [Colletotrichum karsti]
MPDSLMDLMDSLKEEGKARAGKEWLWLEWSPDEFQGLAHTCDSRCTECGQVNAHRSSSSSGLEVVQQPQRARMCGFGDKDRRPITPPPCIRVVVTDSDTGAECNVNDLITDHYIIIVDLWNEAGDQEVNLVGHTSNNTSISTTTPTSFHDLRNEHMSAPYAQIVPHYNGPGMPYAHHPQPPPPMQQYPGYHGYLPPPHGYQSTNSAFAPPTQYYPHQASATVPSQADVAYGGPQRHSMSMAAAQPQGMFTRNLIGSLSSSAFRLYDTDDKVGVWFVMQDLSVRTEGHFRLRFSFVNISKKANEPTADFSLVSMGKSPVLAQCFSDVFQVFSAKKFPGVCESTPLSRCFATQGIKIPIRKDGPSDSKKGNDDEEDFQ